jgi:hypothetical protein
VVLIAVFEFAFGVWLIVKGFNPSSPLFAQPNTDVGSTAAIPFPRSAGEQLDERAAGSADSGPSLESAR